MPRPSHFSALIPHEPPSPLRYPGGKYLLASYISCVLEENYLTGCTFYEPYVGGASVSIELLKRGFIGKAVWVEKDPLIYAFWHAVVHDADRLCAAVEAAPVTIQTWDQLQPLRLVRNPTLTKYSLLQLAAAGLFFNRTNFSGIIGSGPIGGRDQKSDYDIACRFNREKIVAQIRGVAAFAGRIRVHFGDAITFLRRRGEALATGFNFVYIDPPYYVQGRKLYRHFYCEADHVRLARFITAQAYPWLISYDDHSRIRELYGRVEIQPVYLDYKAKSSRRAQELVISNLRVPPPVYQGAVGEPEAAEFDAI